METEYADIEAKLADPNVIADQQKYQTLMRRYKQLTNPVKLYRDYQKPPKIYRMPMSYFKLKKMRICVNWPKNSAK